MRRAATVLTLVASPAAGENRASRRAVELGLVVLLLALAMPALAQPALTDAQIRQMMIDRSIADYLRNHGNCPCPYNIRRDGKRRDDWSAWSRPGGESPLCYPDDIPAAAVITFRATL